MDINRKTAYNTLLDVEAKKAYSNLALNHQIKIGKPTSPAFVRELVYGVLERKLTLDYYLDQLVDQGIDSLKKQELTILRMGIYQIGYMESVPEYAAVNESVSLAKKYCRGRAGLVNGVLREYLNRRIRMRLPERDEDEIRYLSVKYSYAPWIIEKWMEYYRPEFVEKLMEAGNKRPPLTIRYNWLKIVKEDLIKQLEDRGYEVEEGKLCRNSLNVRGTGLLETELYKMGLFTPQDESSTLVAEKLDPKHEDLVIDVCAAPGGKSTAIAERMNNTGKIIAADIYRRRLDQVDKEARRLGIVNIETRAWDATRVDSSLVEKADRVLVDVPCSGLGVLRKKPEIKYRKIPDEGASLTKVQYNILQAAAVCVKPGGFLMYSTCTIHHRENEDISRRFLKEHPAFLRVTERQLLPDEHDTDGFYYCVMKREEDGIEPE